MTVALMRDELTATELVELRAAAGGLTTREAAQARWVVRETVKFHRSSILHKLNAKTMAQAVAVAYEQGILP